MVKILMMFVWWRRSWGLWIYVVVTIEELKDFEDLTIEELKGSLQAHKQKIDKREGRSLEKVLHKNLTIKNVARSSRGSFQIRRFFYRIERGGRSSRNQ